MKGAHAREMTDVLVTGGGEGRGRVRRSKEGICFLGQALNQRMSVRELALGKSTEGKWKNMGLGVWCGSTPGGALLPQH